LLISQVLTLYTTPVVYLYMGRLGAWFKRAKPKADEATQVTAIVGP
jgi:HAE1 family hydrophobic/amphiphilic exporter-1